MGHIVLCPQCHHQIQPAPPTFNITLNHVVYSHCDVGNLCLSCARIGFETLVKEYGNHLIVMGRGGRLQINWREFTGSKEQVTILFAVGFVTIDVTQSVGSAIKTRDEGIILIGGNTVLFVRREDLESYRLAFPAFIHL